MGLLVRPPGARCLAALGLALVAGGLALAVRLEAAQSAAAAAPREVTLEGTVGAAQRTPSSLRVDLHALVEVAPRGVALAGRVRLYALPAEPLAPALAEALPGDRIRALVRLRSPNALRNPGARSSPRALARAGFTSLAGLAHPALVVRLPEREGLRPLRGLHILRRARARQLVALGPGGGLLCALALGDRSGLSEERRAQFARLGLSHLLAVSGLHLALVAGGLYWAAARLYSRSAALCARWDTRRFAAATALAGALGYALLAGWGVPVRRAWCLVVGLVLARSAARPSAWLAPLAGAALFVLALEPEALFLPGAQLSFVAAAALARAAHSDASPVAPWTHGVRTSALAIAATTPLAVWHWGGAAPLALFANLLAVPWTAFALLPAALCACACAAFAELPLAALALLGAERLARVTLEAVAWAAAWAP
ncbi:MAG: ComEC family competence protein, partial [Myxococcales bacterium]|nr:ComEC family competence protein [Myxococcales bacterium]